MLKLKTKFRLVIAFYMMLPVAIFVLVSINNTVFHDPVFQKALSICFAVTVLITMCNPFLIGLNWILLKQANQISDICQDIKNGRYRYFSLPNQPSEVEDENELIALMRTMNWMIHQIENRESELEARVVQRTRDLKETNLQLVAARDEANASAVAKSRFLATMSHEIRTPLNAISGMSDLVLRTDLNDRQKEYMGIINASGKTLLRIINDILDFSKMDADKLVLENIPVSVRELAEEITDLFRHETADKSIEFILDIGPDVPLEILADPTRLRQVLINLVSNAVKFTHEGEISLIIRKTPFEKKERCRLLFDVRDTGIGMDEHARTMLFQAFSQADDSTSRKYGGTGLGLAISQKLVSLMEGEINVQSEVNKGSSFSFVLETEAVKAVISQAEFHHLEGIDKSVLLMVPNRATRSVLEQFMNSFGLPFISTDTFVEDLSDVSLILADLDNPALFKKEGGKAFFSKIAAVPVIGIGAFSQDRLVQPPEWVKYFIPKPVKQSLLFDTLMEICGMRPDSAAPDKNCRDIFNLSGRTCILLVEDNHINQKVAWEILHTAGIDPEIKESGAAALKWLSENSCDAVLMDIQMPGMDGYETTRRIRKLPGAGKLPIIGMSANAMPEDFQKGETAGMDAYITKPIAPELLFDVLSKVLKKSLSLPLKKRIQSRPSTECIIEDYPGIDMDAALSRLQENTGLLKTLLQDFAVENESLFDQILQHIEAGEIESLKALVHRVKGVSRNLSASDFSESLTALENYLNHSEKDFDPADLELVALVGNCRRDFDTICKGVPKNSRQATPPSSQNEVEIDPGFFIRALEMADNLDELLKQNSLNAKAYSKDFSGCLAGSSYESSAVKLESRIKRFDFNSARNVFQELRQKLIDDKKIYGNC